jgi:hypothetical protein
VPQLVVLGWPFYKTVMSSQFAVTMKLKMKLKFVQFLTQTNKGLIMEIYEYDYDGIKLDIHYHTEDGDESVGMFGMQVYVEGVYHKGEDITDLIGKSTYEFIESELYEALNG